MKKLKKFLAVLLVIALVITFVGCGKTTQKNGGASGGLQEGSQNTSQNASQSAQQETIKTAEVNSTPQGAAVYINEKLAGKTPCTLKLKSGAYPITIYLPGYRIYRGALRIKDKENKVNFSVKLTKEPEVVVGAVTFYGVPRISLNGKYDFSGIFVDTRAEISGETLLKSFDIVFPSGKKVHIKTEQTPIKTGGGAYLRVFTKSVSFDEAGTYKVYANGKVLFTSGKTPYKFIVPYKAFVTNLPQLSAFSGSARGGSARGEEAIFVPIGKTVSVKMLLMDAQGVVAKSMPAGEGNYITDEKGYLTIPVSASVQSASPFHVYGNIYGMSSCFIEYDINGHFKEARLARAGKNGKLQVYSPENLPRADVKVIDAHAFVPLQCTGLSLCDVGLGNKNSEILVNEKDPSVIYTDCAVSKDGGNSFRKFSQGITFAKIAIATDFPSVIYGWDEESSALLKSTDYGAHFEKIGSFSEVNRIAVDPKDYKKLFVTDNTGLFVSTDGGESWKSALSCTGCAWINPLNPDTVFVTKCRFKKSTDGGNSWSDIPVLEKYPTAWSKIVQVAFSPDDADTVYAVTDRYIFKSENSGESWTLVNEQELSGIRSIAINLINTKEVFALTENGIFRSENGGKTLGNISGTMQTLSTFRNASITTDRNGKLYTDLCGVPFAYEGGKWALLSSYFFLRNGSVMTKPPQWRVINGTLYEDANQIRTDVAAARVKKGATGGTITFYRLCNLQPEKP